MLVTGGASVPSTGGLHASLILCTTHVRYCSNNYTIVVFVHLKRANKLADCPIHWKAGWSMLEGPVEYSVQCVKLSSVYGENRWYIRAVGGPRDRTSTTQKIFNPLAWPKVIPV